MPKQNNYTCFKFSTDLVKYTLGEIDSSWCTTTLTGRTTNNVSDRSTTIGPWARSGLYYYCGHRTLMVRVPLGSVGTCAMVRLGAPLMLMGKNVKAIPQHNTRTLAGRLRRLVLGRGGLKGHMLMTPGQTRPRSPKSNLLLK